MFQVWLVTTSGDKCSHIESTCSYCKKPRHLAKVCFRKKKESDNNTTHQVIATPTPGATPREAEEDTDCPFTVYFKSVESSGNSSITPSFINLQLQSPNGS